ncbi:hypothetical protein TYRP_009688 [Tyrophagus putrescentiae]|nr:hypothetical protein TYRP_009688 [Tyrophagus putrescentiae]
MKENDWFLEESSATAAEAEVEVVSRVKSSNSGCVLFLAISHGNQMSDLKVELVLRLIQVLLLLGHGRGGHRREWLRLAVVIAEVSQLGMAATAPSAATSSATAAAGAGAQAEERVEDEGQLAEGEGGEEHPVVDADGGDHRVPAIDLEGVVGGAEEEVQEEDGEGVRLAVVGAGHHLALGEEHQQEQELQAEGGEVGDEEAELLVELVVGEEQVAVDEDEGAGEGGGPGEQAEDDGGRAEAEAAPVAAGEEGREEAVQQEQGQQQGGGGQAEGAGQLLGAVHPLRQRVDEVLQLQAELLRRPDGHVEEVDEDGDGEVGDVDAQAAADDGGALDVDEEQEQGVQGADAEQHQAEDEQVLADVGGRLRVRQRVRDVDAAEERGRVRGGAVQRERVQGLLAGAGGC